MDASQIINKYDNISDVILILNRDDLFMEYGQQ